MEPQFTGKPVGSAIEPCPLRNQPATQPVHWIEIRMLGEDDQPIPSLEYRILLPSGEEVKGFLDSHGLARVDGIETPGTCQVSFPELDREAWDKI